MCVLFRHVNMHCVWTLSVLCVHCVCTLCALCVCVRTVCVLCVYSVCVLCVCTGLSQGAGMCVMGNRDKWQETNPWHEAVTLSCCAALGDFSLLWLFICACRQFACLNVCIITLVATALQFCILTCVLRLWQETNPWHEAVTSCPAGLSETFLHCGVSYVRRQITCLQLCILKRVFRLASDRRLILGTRQSPCPAVLRAPCPGGLLFSWLVKIFLRQFESKIFDETVFAHIGVAFHHRAIPCSAVLRLVLSVTRWPPLDKDFLWFLLMPSMMGQL